MAAPASLSAGVPKFRSADVSRWGGTALLAAAVLALNLALAPGADDTTGTSTRLTLGKPFACADYGGDKICLVDAAGRITWQMPAQRPHDVWVLNSGNILFSHVKGAREVTRDKKVVWEFTTAAGNEVHACQPLPEGRVMIAESGPMRIIEVDRQGKIAKEVKLTTECKSTHGQMRGARKLPSGHYLVGQYSDGALREYDPEGKIVWEFRLKMPYGGIRLPNGNTLVGAGDAHRIIEVDTQGKVVWEIKENDLPGNPLRFVAGMHRLPNGNTLVWQLGRPRAHRLSAADLRGHPREEGRRRGLRLQAVQHDQRRAGLGRGGRSGGVRVLR